jgi:hypothetical protein
VLDKRTLDHFRPRPVSLESRPAPDTLPQGYSTSDMIRALILAVAILPHLTLAQTTEPRALTRVPEITRQPSDATVGAGVPVRFVASASSASSYRWFHGENPIENATNSVLTLTNTTFASAGEYKMEASSDLGSVETSAAILTILPPVQLRHLASVQTPGGPQKFGPMWVRVVDDLAYVADSQLQIYDVADPANPIHLSSYGTNSSIFGFFVTNNLVYALDGSFLETINISDPRQPARVGRTNLSVTLTDINVNGSYAYISALQGFLVYDVSNPAQMFQLGRNNSYPGYTVDRVGEVVYIGGTGLGVPIMDVGNPAFPLRTNIVQPGFVDTVKVTGNRLYAAGGAFGVFDITEPKYPKALAAPRPAALNATQGMTARGDFMFTGNKSGILNSLPFFSVFDLQNPNVFLEVARVTFASNVVAESFDLVDNHLYLTAGRYLEIYEWEQSTNTPAVVQGIGTVRTVAGAPAKLEAFATGGGELSYQWIHNTAEPYEIEGATNRVLRFTQVSPTETGTYSVRISNSQGSITNSGTLQLTGSDRFAPAISLGDSRGPRLTFALPEGLQARVEGSSDLAAWEEFWETQSNGAQTNIYDTPGRGLPKRFYRLKYGLD